MALKFRMFVLFFLLIVTVAAGRDVRIGMDPKDQGVFKHYDLVSKNNLNVWKIDDPSISIIENTFVVNKDLEDVTIIIKKLNNETVVPENLTGSYQYLEVRPINLEVNDIKQSTFTFRIENDWLMTTGFDDATLMRYEEEWKSVPTQFVESDKKYSYFKASTPGFSYFAIVGGQSSEEDGYFMELSAGFVLMTILVLVLAISQHLVDKDV